MQNETEIFTENGLSNIFDGAVIINQHGNKQAIGFRWEGVDADKCFIFTRSQSDKNGIYTGNGFVCGIKRKNKTNKSSFFPKDWTRAQVIEAISEAYETRETNSSQTFIIGTSSSCLKILK